MQRVFNATELDCQCSLKSASLDPQTVDVEQISKNKGLLRITTEFETDSVVDVHVSFNGGASLWLIGRVAESGDRGLFLRWVHSNEHAESRLQTALVENADRVAAARNDEEPPQPVRRSKSQAQHKKRSVGKASADSKSGRTSKATANGPKNVSPTATTDAPKSKGAPGKNSPKSSPLQSSGDGQSATATKQKSYGKPVASIPAPNTRPQQSQTQQKPPQKPMPISAKAAQGAARVKPSGTATQPSVSTDGSFDVGAAIMQHAKTVQSADLAANIKQVQVLDMKTITRLIRKAVAEAEQSLETKLTEEQHRQLLQEAEDKFNERLEEFKAQNAGLETRAALLQKQLVDAQALLEEERQRIVSADQFTVSDTGIGELEARFESILENALVEHDATEDVQDELRHLVSHVLDQERERAKEKEEEAQSDAVSLLERKVSRLASALNETESARAKAEKRAQILEQHAGSGAANVMLAGLDDDDPEKEQKLALLKNLHDANQEVREHMKAQSSGKGGLFKSMAESAGMTMQVKKIVVPEQAPPPMTINSADNESGGKEERVDV
ncbi:MAG: hypothetical protein AAF581_20285 [Planctomycetota bacterium]